MCVGGSATVGAFPMFRSQRIFYLDKKTIEAGINQKEESAVHIHNYKHGADLAEWRASVNRQ